MSLKLPWRREDDSADSATAGGGETWLLARYAGPGALLEAADGLRRDGYTRWDAHSPFPVHGLERAMGLTSSRVPLFVLVLGLGGAAAGMLLQWWVSVEAYPLTISGKPLFSWPAFVPIMFECGVLGGALGAVFGFLGLSRLPRHHHPLFHSTAFERMSDDAFFLSVESGDPKWSEGGTTNRLLELGANRVERIDAGGAVTVLHGDPGEHAPEQRDEQEEEEA